MKRNVALSVTLAALAACCYPVNSSAASSAAGSFVTVAGTGELDYSGDGGPATQAKLDTPNALALDGAGNLYISDWGNNRVRKVSPRGIITTLAGTGDRSYSGDDLPATETDLNNPDGLVADGSGGLYISDQNNNRVRRVSPDGIMTTVAGSGRETFMGDGGPATRAGLWYPAGLAVDSHGILFVADLDHGRVRKVTPDGMITTVAGTGAGTAEKQSAGGGGGYSFGGYWGGGDEQLSAGDGGPAAMAELGFPQGLAVDSAGNLFIADGLAHRVRKVSPDGIITTVAGSGPVGFDQGDYAGDGGPALAARLNDPEGIAVDSAGNLFIADHGNRRVRKVSPQGIITTVAGDGLESFPSTGPNATKVGLMGPYSVAVDASGNLLIADSATSSTGTFGLFDERVLKVSGVAAPGLIAGRPFPR